MAKRIIITFIILASLSMFKIAFLGEGILKVVELAGIGVILLVILLQFIYNHGEGFVFSFKWEMVMIFTSILLSMLMASSGHDQGIGTTAIAQRSMYFYFFYFALHLIKISNEDLEKLMLYLAVAHVLFYMMQFMAHPTKIFEVRTSEDRGTLRIFLPGLSYLMLAYFYVLNRLFKDFSVGRLALLFFFFSVFVLMGTRQIILSMFMLTMVNVLLSKRVKSKSLILLLVLLSVVPIVFMFQEIFVNMLSVSQEQSEGFEEDIRVRAATFFLVDLFPNKISYITGNGADSASTSYGAMIQTARDAFGYYQSDVGLIGDYSKFGAFLVIAALSIMIRILAGKLSEDFIYIKYFYINILMTLFTGGGAFGEGDSIVAVCFTLYMIDVDKHNRKVLAEEETNFDDEVEDEDEPLPEVNETPVKPYFTL